MVLAPVAVVTTVTTLPVPAVEDISVGVQGTSVVARRSSGGKKAQAPKSKMAGGKVPKKTRAPKQGGSRLVEGGG